LEEKIEITKNLGRIKLPSKVEMKESWESTSKI